jgi:hypothetical protein
MASNSEIVKIRFNTNFVEGSPSIKEWRVLISNQEYFCNHISIFCPSYTTKDMIEGVGEKWHISCNPSSVEYVKDERLKDEKALNLFKEIILR